MKFTKGDIIRQDGIRLECIIADEKTAVFAKITKWEKGEKKVNYTKLFAIDQEFQDGFEYELLVSIPGVVKPDSEGYFYSEGYSYKNTDTICKLYGTKEEMQKTGDILAKIMDSACIDYNIWSVDEIVEELKDIDAFDAAKYFFDKYCC